MEAPRGALPRLTPGAHSDAPELVNRARRKAPVHGDRRPAALELATQRHACVRQDRQPMRISDDADQDLDEQVSMTKRCAMILTAPGTLMSTSRYAYATVATSSSCPKDSHPLCAMPGRYRPVDSG